MKGKDKKKLKKDKKKKRKDKLKTEKKKPVVIDIKGALKVKQLKVTCYKSCCKSKHTRAQITRGIYDQLPEKLSKKII